MRLTLTLAAGQQPGGSARATFQEDGGTIGRLPGNDLVLPDPHVSGRHAVVRYADGVFYVEDTSTNGTSINSTENRVPPGKPQALRSGDRILIDPFELETVITTNAAPAGASSLDPFGLELASEYPGLSEIEDVDPLKLLGLKSSEPPPSRRPEPNVGSVINEPYRPPPPTVTGSDPRGVSGSLIPDDYDPLLTSHPSLGESAEPAPSVRKSTSRRLSERAQESSDAAPDGGGLSTLLAGAGLVNVPASPDLARSLGAIFRVVVSGVMDVLRARQDTKEEFRIGMTRFKPADNNPLKFSANVDDALHNLLIKRNAAYLEPVEAFEDAFEDLRNHQVATLAGMQVAFKAMLADFNPDALQKQFDDAAKKHAQVPVLSRFRYWHQYRNRFRELTRDADASFRELFGERFAEAYDEQLKRLKAARRERTLT